MRFDLKEWARGVIDQITVALDCDLIKQKFDEPIGRVLDEFVYEATSSIDHYGFHKITADFVGQVYDRALKVSLTPTDPLAKAISLLDQYYQSAQYGTGYIAARLDAEHTTGDGLQTVLRSLAESIKDIEKQKYINGVFISHLPSNEWYLQCEIARILLQDYGAFMTEQLRRCAPAQIVGQLPAIMHNCLYNDSVLQQISFQEERHLTGEILLNRQLL
jgi:hypothetical protein